MVSSNLGIADLTSLANTSKAHVAHTPSGEGATIHAESLGMISSNLGIGDLNSLDGTTKAHVAHSLCVRLRAGSTTSTTALSTPMWPISSLYARGLDDEPHRTSNAHVAHSLCVRSWSRPRAPALPAGLEDEFAKLDQVALPRIMPISGCKMRSTVSTVAASAALSDAATQLLSKALLDHEKKSNLAKNLANHIARISWPR